MFICVQIFYPITTDLYDRKNMPRVIYCIHALRLDTQYCTTVPHSVSVCTVGAPYALIDC